MKLRHRLRYHRRAGMLALLGIVEIAFGLGFVTHAETSLDAITAWLPPDFGEDIGGILWIGCGTFAIVAAAYLMHSGRRSTWVDAAAFSLLVLPPTITAGVVIVSMTLVGAGWAWPFVVKHAAIAAVAFYASGWEEAPSATP